MQLIGLLLSNWQPTPVFLPGESHGWRSLVGYGPRGRKQSDTTDGLHFHFHYVPSVCGYLLYNSHSISRQLSQLRRLVALCSACDGEGINPLLQVPQVHGAPPAPGSWTAQLTSPVTTGLLLEDDSLILL